MNNQTRYALISVSDKSGVATFTERLTLHGFKIISTGGTARVLRDAGLAVQDSEEFTGIGSILEDRVKTLCPHLHGGMLAVERMQEEFDKLKYPWIDLVCVNLYPLAEKIASGATPEEVLENTDIGGVAMLRSAGKGRRIIASGSEDYPHILEWLDAGCPRDAQFRTLLAYKAEVIAAHYCDMSAGHIAGLLESPKSSWESAIYQFAVGRHIQGV